MATLSLTDGESGVFHVGKKDCDVRIVFPGGKELLIEIRPSNAEEDYNGSLDIILPGNTCVECYKWSDVYKPAKPINDNRHQQHIRIAKQLVAELPGDYS